MGRLSCSFPSFLHISRHPYHSDFCNSKSLPFLRPSRFTNTSSIGGIMNSCSQAASKAFCPPPPSSSVIYQLPGLESAEMDTVSQKAFERYALKQVRRSAGGVAIIWFRNDLRVLDNETLFKAWVSSESTLPVYCIDPRQFETTHYFGFPKTGALRAQFVMECLADLKKNLTKRGLNLLIRRGKPEEIIPSLAEAFGAHTVFSHKETCSEEIYVEKCVREGLSHVSCGTKLQLLWENTMYHIDDLPFRAAYLPDVYTQFRRAVEAKCSVRSCIKIPMDLGPPPPVDDWGCVPSLNDLGIHSREVPKGLKFVGGETAGLSRVNEYFWKKDLLKVYKETRNGMLGPDYSTKFSPWLASGSLSPRYIYEEVKRYEKERRANDSTYWVLFELIWRDYFRFLSIKCRNSLFQLGGPRNLEKVWSQNQALFECWRDGCTGYPLIDANMKELSATGFMSNRGRQIVCSFLVRDMGIDWRMGAEWFETSLLDYDPCSNYGNWTYGAGVGNDPREDRYFSIPKQAQTYDPEGKYVAFWVPELRQLPREKRNFPGRAYMNTVVPLKFGNTAARQRPGQASVSSRKTNTRVNGR